MVAENLRETLQEFARAKNFVTGYLHFCVGDIHSQSRQVGLQIVRPEIDVDADGVTQTKIATAHHNSASDQENSRRSGDRLEEESAFMQILSGSGEVEIPALKRSH